MVLHRLHVVERVRLAVVVVAAAQHLVVEPRRVERLVTTDNVALALAAFQRSIVSFRSPYDRYIAFLQSLTDEALLRDPRWGDPWTVSVP